MSKELSVSIGIPEKIGAYKNLASAAFKSGFFRHVGSEDAVLTILFMADELKIGHMEALMGGITVVQGRAEISPRLMNKMIREAGHRIETIKLDSNTCSLKGVRSDTGQEECVSFSIDDARRAGLVRAGSGWEKYPSDMLYARCLSRLGRRLFADVISTSYISKEIEEEIEVPQQKEMAKEIIEISAEKVEEPKKESMHYDEFINKIKESARSEFDGFGIQDFLLHLSTKKGGKAIPIEHIMNKSLEQIDRFLNSYEEWLPTYKLAKSS